MENSTVVDDVSWGDNPQTSLKELEGAPFVDSDVVRDGNINSNKDQNHGESLG